MQLAFPLLDPVVSVMEDPCHGHVWSCHIFFAIDQYQNHLRLFLSSVLHYLHFLLSILDRSSCSLLVG